MSTIARPEDSAKLIVEGLRAYIDRTIEENGGITQAVKPSHRVKFHWPPHPISYSYHVLTTDWTGSGRFDAHGETFEVQVARTRYGVFGRCEQLWLETRGDSLEAMLQAMVEAAEPLFRRQFCISKSLGLTSRFTGHINELSPVSLVKLLYCEDRDVANEARSEIEKHASQHIFTPALIEIIRDNRHPFRRSAQWCVLDLFEDLPSFATKPDEETEALHAIKGLIWDAEDDYARTIYKAGVVMGGHLPHKAGGELLIECLQAPSRIGRRSAIHGLFHTVEWIPDMRESVVSALQASAKEDPDPQLREFAELMARDIAKGDYDHIPEPIFPDEN